MNRRLLMAAMPHLQNAEPTRDGTEAKADATAEAPAPGVEDKRAQQLAAFERFVADPNHAQALAELAKK